jgi:hypothetical protein
MPAPEMALFMAIDFHCSLQKMAGSAGARQEDVVTYFVNRDAAGWVEQRVRRRVYIELKLECTRNRCRDNQKARDDWLCLYCRAVFPSKLRLTYHRVVGCPLGPVDSTGSKLQLPVYPNLKTAKQGKDLKLALQRGDGSVWGSLHDNDIWLELNPELVDVTHPPLGARVQVRQFLEPTVTTLIASPTLGGDVRPQKKLKPQRPSKQHDAETTSGTVVITDKDDESETPLSRLKKRSHADMAGGHRVYHSPRQFKHSPRKPAPKPHVRQPSADRHSPQPPRSGRQATPDAVPRRPPPHPIRVTPIQSRSPSPDRGAILAVATPPPMQHATPDPATMQQSTSSPPPMQSSACSQDLATTLRKDRAAFYVKVASGARAAVKMDIPKPALRPAIQPPGLFYLIPCGLLKFDLECCEFQAFQDEVHKWQADPHFQDRLYAAYGRFYDPLHQVHSARLQCCFYIGQGAVLIRPQAHFQ